MHIAEVKGLTISFGKTVVANNLNFTIARGKITALTGESGSGKSLTAFSFLRLLPKAARVQGSVIFKDAAGAETDLLSNSEKHIRNFRGKRIAMIFQEPMSSLNPLICCGEQVAEQIRLHSKSGKRNAKEKTLRLFHDVELPHPEKLYAKYPHQISGGQKQRVMIAMAMSCEPQLLIADEPTTALDVRVQKKILDLIKRLAEQKQLSVLLITHDLGVVADYAEDVIVLRKGEIVEQGKVSQVFSTPKTPYTQSLLNAAVSLRLNKEGRKGQDRQQHFEGLLCVDDLKVGFPVRKNIFGKPVEWFNAVDGVSFEIKKGELLGIAGESGSGKTTLGRAILGLVKASGGSIRFENMELTTLSNSHWRSLRKEMRIVFQDPYSSLNQRLSVGDIVEEPLILHENLTKRQRRERTAALFEQVKLDPGMMNRKPHAFSGGQRQRISIARALAGSPDFLVFDESVSALDLRIQSQILDLIEQLRADRKFTGIFISHDLHVIRRLCDRVMIIHNGKIEEQGAPADIFANPQSVYTQELLDSLPGKRLSLQTF